MAHPGRCQWHHRIPRRPCWWVNGRRVVVVRSGRCPMTNKGEIRVEKQIAGDDSLLSTQRCERQREQGNSTEARNFGEEIVQERKISRRRGQKPLGCGGLPSGGVEPWRRGAAAPTWTFEPSTAQIRVMTLNLDRSDRLRLYMLDCIRNIEEDADSSMNVRLDRWKGGLRCQSRLSRGLTA